MVIERSALVGLTTSNVACVECVVVPDWPLMSNWWLPSGVFAAVPSVNVAVFEVASLITTDVGLNTGAPAGKLAALKLTVPRNPASGVTVTVY